VAKEFDQITPFVAFNQVSPPWLPGWANAFFSMLGATFFSVQPAADRRRDWRD
jgi:hypothetical protein